MSFAVVISEENLVQARIKTLGAVNKELGVMLAFGYAFSPFSGNSIFLPGHGWWRGTLHKTNGEIQQWS